VTVFAANPPAAVEHSAELDAALARIAAEVVSEFADKGLTPEGLSISVIDLTPRGAALPAGAWRGDVPYYPASVVKAFYLAYYESRKEAGKLSDTPELVRAVKDMITVSSNDATGFVVDSITDTTSGPEIGSARKWKKWTDKRNAVNRFYAERGYRDLNANQKTFCEDAYGREQAFRDEGRNRNRMTTDAVARLFKEIAQGEIVGPAGTQQMLALLSRDITPDKPYEDLELEDARLVGKRLPAGTKVWSKSGDAYDVHHLVGRVLLPGGADFVVAAFTKGVKTVPDVIPRIYEKVGGLFTASRTGDFAVPALQGASAAR
jgi:Beta-lactamase enzyme family